MNRCCYLLFLLVAVATGLQAQRLSYVPGDVLVQMAERADVRRLVQRLETWQGQPTGVRVERELSPPFRIWLLHFDFATVHEEEFLALIRRQPDVQVAQFNHLLSYRDTIPNDPFFGQQWQWVNTGQNGGTSDADVDADQAWDITTGGLTAAGDEIVVCVMEGAIRNHPDLLGNLWFNPEEIPGNGIDDDGNGYLDDYNGWNMNTGTDVLSPSGHGTIVSGMIGAKGNNEQLVSGINWNVKIMHVEVGPLQEANVVAAYTYPYLMRKRYNETDGQSGAFVVATNASWGIDFGQPADAPLWCAFYDSLGTVGILSCGATINSNVNVDVVGDLPTACPSEYLISVTASNSSDVRTFSGFGIEHIDVAAPGENIVSISGNSGPQTTSGTSFASPLVAGLVGLLYSTPCSTLSELARSTPEVAAAMVRDAIFAGVDTVSQLTTEVKYGGRVNAYNSLLYLIGNCGSCLPPFSLSAFEIADTSASITWLAFDSTLFSSLRYRLAGDTVWTVVDSVASPLFLNDLQPCSSYEVQISATCADTTSLSSGFVFATDGCCVPPDGLSVSALTDSSATLSWNSVLAAQSYNVFISAPSGNDTLAGVSATGLSLSGLTPCTEYTVQVQTICDTGATVDLVQLDFKTPGCGACLDRNYCPSKGESSEIEWIANVTIDTFSNTSANSQGFQDFTGLGPELTTYKVYPVSLTPGYAGGAFQEWFAMWIDFDQDGDFDNDEMVFNSGGTVTTTVTGVITVPPTALPGLTRLRVSMRWNAQPGPCTNFDFGEVEDYCVTILEGSAPDCSFSDELDTAFVSFTSAHLLWSPVLNALSYELQFRPVGGASWQTQSVQDTFYLVSGLEACTDYEFRVRSGCGFVESDWSVAFLFKTACYAPCLEVPAGLDTAQVSSTAAQLLWQPTTAAEKYILRLWVPGEQDTTFLSTGNNSLTVGNLDSCQVYAFNVQAQCPGEQLSTSSEVFTFATQCLNAVTAGIPGLEQILIQPNPFSQYLEVRFQLLWPSELSATLYDPLGRRVIAQRRALPAGDTRWRLEGWSDLPAGTYLLRLHNQDGSVALRVVKAGL